MQQRCPQPAPRTGHSQVFGQLGALPHSQAQQRAQRQAMPSVRAKVGQEVQAVCSQPRTLERSSTYTRPAHRRIWAAIRALFAGQSPQAIVQDAQRSQHLGRRRSYKWFTQHWGSSPRITPLPHPAQAHRAQNDFPDPPCRAFLTVAPDFTPTPMRQNLTAALALR